ncbi:MAG TPA: hypothetical protein VGH60_08685 [Solirubrobacteraceae bacterium]|jgi:hypothetical protein
MRANRSVLAQRAIVLQLLRDDHLRAWTRAELEQALGLPVKGPLAKLAAENVISLDDFGEGEEIRASWCVRHLDTLGLIAV